MKQDITSNSDGVIDIEETREQLQTSEEPPTPSISLSDVRPLPKVSQTTPKARRGQKQLSRFGRTRILTHTPETNIITENHKKQMEKIEKSRRRLQPATEKIKNNKGKLQKRSNIATTSDYDSSLKENVNVHSTKSK